MNKLSIDIQYKMTVQFSYLISVYGHVMKYYGHGGWRHASSLYACMSSLQMAATANPIHLMHIINVHHNQTSHRQAATEEGTPFIQMNAIYSQSASLNLCLRISKTKQDKWGNTLRV